MTRTQKVALLSAGVGLGAWLIARKRPAHSFADKTVLLIGGSRGLGLVLARALTREGSRLALCARDPEELQRAADALGEMGRRPLTTPCDVTDPEQVARK